MVAVSKSEENSSLTREPWKVHSEYLLAMYSLFRLKVIMAIWLLSSEADGERNFLFNPKIPNVNMYVSFTVLIVIYEANYIGLTLMHIRIQE